MKNEYKSNDQTAISQTGGSESEDLDAMAQAAADAATARPLPSKTETTPSTARRGKNNRRTLCNRNLKRKGKRHVDKTDKDPRSDIGRTL